MFAIMTFNWWKMIYIFYIIMHAIFILTSIFWVDYIYINGTVFRVIAYWHILYLWALTYLQNIELGNIYFSLFVNIMTFNWWKMIYIFYIIMHAIFILTSIFWVDYIYIKNGILPISLGCPFLLAPLVFSNVYLRQMWFLVIVRKVKNFHY
jgi:hypothetical protein